MIEITEAIKELYELTRAEAALKKRGLLTADLAKKIKDEKAKIKPKEEVKNVGKDK